MAVCKYPLLLVHGLGMRDDLKWPNYWGEIPEKLRENNVNLYISNQMAFNTIELNAEIIKERVLEICKVHGCSKINVIAHSKGGIETRYIISKLNMAQHIASLTTLSTPHRGSTLADWAIEKAQEHKAVDLAEKFIKAIATWQGDESPEIMPAFRQMTTYEMAKMNEELPDMPQVYYQSYAGAIQGKPYGWWTMFKEKIIFEKEGENDSVVSVHSAIWGDYKGIIKSPKGKAVSHHEMVDFTHFTDFDAPEFYLQIVKKLGVKGF